MKIEDVLLHPDFIFALCSFLDEFKHSEDKFSLICDEPHIEQPDMSNLCVLAAVAHKLANDNGLDLPDWVEKQKYVLPQPAYSYGTKNKEYQAFLRETSPYEFASRNIFFGANAIERI